MVSAVIKAHLVPQKVPGTHSRPSQETPFLAIPPTHSWGLVQPCLLLHHPFPGGGHTWYGYLVIQHHFHQPWETLLFWAGPLPPPIPKSPLTETQAWRYGEAASKGSVAPGTSAGFGRRGTRKKDRMTVLLLRARALPPANPMPLPLAAGSPQAGSFPGPAVSPQACQRGGERDGESRGGWLRLVILRF